METKTQIPEVSDAEYKVLRIIWGNPNGVTSVEIIQSLEEEVSWSPKTIKTLIHRLKKKGVLDAKSEKREFVYFSKVPQELFLKRESKNFLKKIFDGATAPMLSHFIQSEKLNRHEIEEIKSLLDSLAKETDLK